MSASNMSASNASASNASASTPARVIDPNRRTEARLLLAVAAIWLAAVATGAQTGFFASLYMPWIAAIVAASIALPTLWYVASPGLRAFFEHVGHRPIAAMHMWRIPAALLFFWYGAMDELPPLFWILAGVGDFIAGGYAAWVTFQPESRASYWRFHVFGFTDFVVAVGAGLTFTLLLDPRMAAIATLPMALIPLFGVGVSGASHLIAFDMLRRDVGFKTGSSPG